MAANHAVPTTSPSRGRRFGTLALTALVMAVATLFAGPASPAVAAPPKMPPANACTTAEWRNPANFASCAGRLTALTSDRVSCVKAPIPSAPDSGMAGWFATRPAIYDQPGIKGQYSTWGYAGYDYTTYDIGCVPTLMHPDYKFENTTANGEFLVATSIIGAANALRDRAWNPASMWKWADPLVEKATRAVYDKVFTVFGAVTLVIVGMYLLWRAKQSDMSGAVTTAGWAILVMVAVTAIAAWPTWSANAADHTLMTSLDVVHNAIGTPTQDIPPDQCRNLDPAACKDNRDPALRASDTAVEGMLYRNWLRGELGSDTSDTAKKYGPVLYDAKSFTWGEIQDIRKDPSQRDAIINAKADRWERVAEQIKTEDPEAYEYLTGVRGMERIGAGFTAILSAIFFGLFDVTASVLVLLGFLIFRWAVVAAPILGTLGLLRPASAGIRRLTNVVIAAIFNIVIFGTGAAIYLLAVSTIMGTDALPGWLQMVLILLTGVVGWMLLRPYRRITQLSGKSSAELTGESGGWGRLLLRDLRAASTGKSADEAGSARSRGGVLGSALRPESQREAVVVAGASAQRGGAQQGAAGGKPAPRPEQSTPGVATEQTAPSAPQSEPVATPVAPPRRVHQWEEPDVPAEAPSYHVYRPGADREPAPASASRRPESVRVSG